MWDKCDFHTQIFLDVSGPPGGGILCLIGSNREKPGMSVAPAYLSLSRESLNLWRRTGFPRESEWFSELNLRSLWKYWWGGDWGCAGWYFPLSLQQTRVRVESLRYKALPSWVFSSPPRRGSPPEIHHLQKEVLEGKLDGWGVGVLEAVPCPESGRGWSVKEVTFDPRWDPCGWWGWRCGWKPSAQWEAVFSFSHQLRVGMSRCEAGYSAFFLKDVVSAKCVQAHFWWFCSSLGIFGKPWKILDNFHFYYF